MSPRGLRLGGKDVVIALALLAAGAYGAWVAVAASGSFGARWTDGARIYDSLGSGVRYAVWDEPQPIAGELNSREREGRAALSPDGRMIVFQVGERGRGADLYACELVDGVAIDPRPLDSLNTPLDELAPAFSADSLLFASDRSADGNGLDLWRAPYRDGGFGAAELLGPGVNTPSDETDPLALPGSRDVVFASDRPRGARTDFELYVAAPARAAGARGFEVARLAELSSTGDEREPGVTADGMVLVFASDRSGGSGAFDLYRSLRGADGWLPPTPLEGLNTQASERAPLVSPDGFALTYSRDASAPEEGGAAADSDLFRARSRELFPLPPRALSAYDLLVLGALLLLALLAFLAKRWRRVEFFYKCFFASLIAHLLILWYLSHVYPEASGPAGPGDDRVFRITFRPGSELAGGGNAERSGALGTERSATSSVTAPGRVDVDVAVADVAAAPGAGLIGSLERGMRVEALPGRGGLAVVPAGPARVEPVRMNDAEAAGPRYSGAAPGLALSARPAAAAPARSAGAVPDRAAARAGAPSAALSARDASFETLALGERASEAPPAPAPRGATPVMSVSESTVDVAVGLPEEEGFERRAGAAPELALPDAGAKVATPARDNAGSGPARSSVVAPAGLDGELGDAAGEGGGPLPLSAGSLASLAPPRLTAGAPPARQALGELEPGLHRTDALGGGGSVDLQDVEPAEAAAPRGGGAPQDFDPTAGLALASPAPARSRGSPDSPAVPERLRLDERPGAPAAPAPVERALEVASAPAALPDDLPKRIEHTPYRNRFGLEKEKALELFGGGVETEAAVKAGLEYLARIQNELGYWGSTSDRHAKYRHVLIGKTGLALLAFLGAGHTHLSGTKHSGVVRRALDLLLEVQDESSGHFGNSSAYCHGIATYALGECYAITKDEALRHALERAVRHIAEEQQVRGNPRNVGGWPYYYADGSGYNGDSWPRVSITAWQVMALASARLGGVEVAPEVLDRARTFLLSAWDERRGAFRYCHDPDRINSGYPILPASTPAAIFALSLLGVPADSDELQGAVDFVLARAPHGYRYDGDDAFVFQATGNDYFWYYATLAMFRAGGSSWNRWNAAMKETLLEGQDEDGSWPPISVYADYAGDDDEDRSYTTALCVLSLEVYYRYFTPLLEEK